MLVTRELEALRAEDLPEDPDARLSMARGALETGDWSDALMIYETLVSSSEMLDSVIENLEFGVRRHPDDPAGYQLLGDACMKDGRLGAALEAYRTALSKL
jgi:cytochrome c-type biogenesis protein CcmH/NrfG